MMSYGLIEISQVSAVETPLVAQLAGTIFDDGGVTRQRVSDAMSQSARESLSLIAHLEGNPLAYAVALAPTNATGACDIVSLAVLEIYRRETVGSRLLEQVESFARLHKCRQLRITCPSSGVDPAARAFLDARGFAPDPGGVVWNKPLG
jgi:GNAT superfamily N-acetyltransferase